MSRTPKILLSQVAHTRSGDKGNHANIGVIAYTPEGYAFLRRSLTAARMARHFAALWPPGEKPQVERYELPGIGGLNFVLKNCLAGGASRSLRIDTQGKLLGTAALEIELPRPANQPRAFGRRRRGPSRARFGSIPD